MQDQKLYPRTGLSLDKIIAVSFPFLMLYLGYRFGTLSLWSTEGNEIALIVIAIALSIIGALRILIIKNKLSYKVEHFLREFWPIPIVLLGYLAMRFFRIDAVTDMLGILLKDLAIIQLDIMVFGQPLPFYIQHWVSPAMTFLMENAYLHFYYAMPIGSMIYLAWKENYATFYRLRVAIILAMITGWFAYLLVPVEGPIKFIPEQFAVPLVPSSEVVYGAVESFRYAYDCFPSLHTAIPWLTLFICWSYYSHTLKMVALFMTLSITTATLYLRYHYGIDVMAGFFWAIMAWLLTSRVEKRYQHEPS